MWVCTGAQPDIFQGRGGWDLQNMVTLTNISNENYNTLIKMYEKKAGKKI